MHVAHSVNCLSDCLSVFQNGRAHARKTARVRMARSVLTLWTTRATRAGRFSVAIIGVCAVCVCVWGGGGGAHTPSTAFRHLPPRKDVVNQRLEFGGCLMCCRGRFLI